MNSKHGEHGAHLIEEGLKGVVGETQGVSPRENKFTGAGLACRLDSALEFFFSGVEAIARRVIPAKTVPAVKMASLGDK